MKSTLPLDDSFDSLEFDDLTRRKRSRRMAQS
jgi:hypothetical protein